MARYRTYKNGIIGHRYKGYYIIRGEGKGKFKILNGDTTVFRENIYDYDECEWIIDKETADKETLQIIKMLYEKDIYELSELFVELMQKKEKQGILEGRSQDLYQWVEKVRRRKASDREL